MSDKDIFKLKVGPGLLFKDGDLLDARLQELQGKPAAYEIFSWDKVTLSIQDTCALKEKKIDEELQAILFNAMRLKDEAEDNGKDEEESYKEDEAENNEKPVDETLDVTEAEKDIKMPEPSEIPVADIVRHKLEKAMGEKNFLENIYQDSAWDGLLMQAVKIGKFFGAEALQSCYIKRGESTDFILLPGVETTVITVSPNCPRDRILQTLSE